MADKRKGGVAVVGLLVLVAAAPQLWPQDAPDLQVRESGVGTGIVDRDLEGRGERFVEGTRVWFWTRVVGGSPGQRIRHVWSRDVDEVISIGLTVGGSHWRTWSVKTLYPGSAGAWSVEARDEQGRVLARAEFTCAAPGEPSDPEESPGDSGNGLRLLGL